MSYVCETGHGYLDMDSSHGFEAHRIGVCIEHPREII